MANYAEQLAYWYLRLNGFFLISNYVYHQIQEDPDGQAYNADADLLAIRPPYYYEQIPHKERDNQGEWQYFHTPLDSADWLREFERRWLGVIVEVKGGEHMNEVDIQRAFSVGRLTVSVNRLGFHPDTEGIVGELANNSRCDFHENSILKIVFSQRNIDGPWKFIDLIEADDFIIDRMTTAENYNAKMGSRFFFPGELIQYMIWANNKRPRLRDR